MINAELASGAAEAGHDLVGYQQHAVLGADLAHLRPVTGWRDDSARSAAYDRLSDKRGDCVRALSQDDLFQPLRGAFDATVCVAPELALQAVVRGRLREVEEERLHTLAPVDVAADGKGGEGGAVIRLLAAYDFPAPITARGDVVRAGQPDGGIHGLEPPLVKPTRVSPRGSQFDVSRSTRRMRASVAKGGMA